MSKGAIRELRGKIVVAFFIIGAVFALIFIGLIGEEFTPDPISITSGIGAILFITASFIMVTKIEKKYGSDEL